MLMLNPFIGGDVVDRVQDKFITLNGLRFHYRDWGTSDAPVLIALHGVTSTAYAWDTTARALCDRYRILALDQRGHGETEWAKEYSVASALADVETFVRELGLKKFVLVGHSMGGRIAYYYAPRHLDQIEHLVIVDIGPEIAPAFVKRLQTAMQANDIFNNPEEAFQILRAGNPRPSDDAMRQLTHHNLMQLADGKWTWRYDRGLRNGERPLERLDGESQWSILSQITSPTLLVRGAETDLLERSTAERMARTIPNCKLVEIPNAGHSVPLDNPEGFIAALQEFL